jgi:hypothetical protein
MSADKRKRFPRACALMREVNLLTRDAGCIEQSGRGRFSTKNPVVRYCLDRGLARMERRLRWKGGVVRRTFFVIDDGAKA